MNPVEKYVKLANSSNLHQQATEIATGSGTPWLKQLFSPANIAAQWGGALSAGVGTALAGSAVYGLSRLGSKAYDAMTKADDYKKMLEFNEDLRTHSEVDPKNFNQMYTSLRRMNPEFGKDPLIAGTFMRRMLETPSGAGGILAEARRDLAPTMGDKVIEKAIGATGDSMRGGLAAINQSRLQTAATLDQLHRSQLDQELHENRKKQLAEQVGALEYERGRRGFNEQEQGARITNLGLQADDLKGRISMQPHQLEALKNEIALHQGRVTAQQNDAEMHKARLEAIREEAKQHPEKLIALQNENALHALRKQDLEHKVNNAPVLLRAAKIRAVADKLKTRSDMARVMNYNPPAGGTHPDDPAIHARLYNEMRRV